MLKNLIVATALLAFVAAANGGISARFVEVPASPGFITIDLQVTTVDDDWTLAGVTATLTGGAFFINNDDFNPPVPGAYGDPMDSFFTLPGGYPNADMAFDVVPTFTEDHAETAQEISAVWFDTTNDPDGTYTILRLTIDWDNATPGFLILDAGITAASTGGQVFHVEYTPLRIPEPAGLALLALGALAAVRRR